MVVKFLLFCAAACALLGYGFRQLRIRNACRRQVVFIRETVVASSGSGDGRIIVSLSTLPDRIGNLEPTLNCLLGQSRPPDEIVIALPSFSIRQRQAYVIPASLNEVPRLRILQNERDWGPATKFIPVIQHELAAARPDTLVMVVDDDRIYPRDA